MDNIEIDNKKILLCLRNLKYVSKEVKEAERIEREKAIKRKKEEKLQNELERQAKREA